MTPWPPSRAPSPWRLSSPIHVEAHSEEVVPQVYNNAIPHLFHSLADTLGFSTPAVRTVRRPLAAASAHQMSSMERRNIVCSHPRSFATP